MQVKDILEKLSKGKMSVKEAHRMLSLHAVEYVEDFAKLDIGRSMRKGVPEVVYGENKNYSDLTKIADAALKRRGSVIITIVRRSAEPNATGDAWQSEDKALRCAEDAVSCKYENQQCNAVLSRCRGRSSPLAQPARAGMARSVRTEHEQAAWGP